MHLFKKRPKSRSLHGSLQTWHVGVALPLCSTLNELQTTDTWVAPLSSAAVQLSCPSPGTSGELNSLPLTSGQYGHSERYAICGQRAWMIPQALVHCIVVCVHSPQMCSAYNMAITQRSLSDTSLIFSTRFFENKGIDPQLWIDWSD